MSLAILIANGMLQRFALLGLVLPRRGKLREWNGDDLPAAALGLGAIRGPLVGGVLELLGVGDDERARRGGLGCCCCARRRARLIIRCRRGGGGERRRAYRGERERAKSFEIS